jgi:hypothetical protein
MFSSLENMIFEFFNMYLRNSVFDTVLPLFESSLPVFLVAFISLIVFAIYCNRKYGEMICRVFLFMGMLGLSAFFAHHGSHFFAFERPRPYQEIAGTMYFDAKDKIWLQAQYAVKDEYHPVQQIEETEKNGQGENLHEENSIKGENLLTEENQNTALTADNVQEDGKENEMAAPNQEENEGAGPPLRVDFEQLQVKWIDGSAKLFPSSVISISMAIAFVIALLMARSSPYIYLFPLLIGWAQIYTGSAYLSDLLVGWCVGLLSVVAAWLCFAFFFRITGKYI